MTYGPSGARVYVNGLPWAVLPTVPYAGSPYTADSSQLFLGDSWNGGAPLSVTLHDAQIYDYELSPAAIAALNRGAGYAC